jgi:nucleoside-diphosphate-sugar epimerase
MSEKIKILITGGFGALSHNLIKKLHLDSNNEIHVIDNLSAGTANFSKSVTFTHLDIGNTEKISAFFKNYKPNYIYHLAAHFANQNSVDHPISDVSTNVIGIINLFETQKGNNELKKIVYMSSSCVYGNSEIMSETVNVNPYDTPYAINKYVGELYCKYYSEIHNIPSVCIRIFNNYGPGEMPGPYRNVIPNFIQKALQNENIIITGTGNETRDFTYVDDTINLITKLAKSKYCMAELFNGGTGVKTTIKFLAETIIELTESSSKIIYVAPREWDHVKDRCSDITKSSQMIGYKPEGQFRDGLIEAIQWIKKKMKQ